MQIHITMTREDIRDMLDVNENTLKSIIKRNKLEDRLNVLGFTLIEEQKFGKFKVYLINVIDKKGITYLQKKYHLKEQDKNKHVEYSYHRLDNGYTKTKAQIIRQCTEPITKYQAKKYDDILEKERIMDYNGECYVKYNSLTKEMKFITEQEYSDFWKRNSYAQHLMRDNRKQLDKRNITIKQYDMRRDIIVEEVRRGEKIICYKYDSYKEANGSIEWYYKFKQELQKQKQ